MISYFFWLMNYIRENVFEAFIIPELNISYWDLCIAFLIIGLLITVLVNGVKSSVRSSSNSVKKARKDKSNSNSSGSDE